LLFFFTLPNCFDWYFFSIPSLNIKIIGNWTFWLSYDLRFHELQVWGLTQFKRFTQVCLVFFFYSFLSSSFGIYLIRYWSPLFFFCFMYEFLLVLKMNCIFSSLLLVIFFLLNLDFFSEIFYIK
jgi:hypothetical protein